MRAQSSQWDAALSNTQWYVPAENMLAYLAAGTDLSQTVAVPDQTIWSLGEVVNGQFTGTAEAEFKLGSATFTSTNTMNGIVTDSGQVRILFTDSGSPTTVGIGQLRDIAGTTYFEMQMISGGSAYVTHWAYMAPYDGNPVNLPPLEVPSTELRSPEWSWMAGTEWAMQNDELFGVGEYGSFSVTEYHDGYFWGTGSGPAGSEAASFSFLGSATPEGNILFNLLSGDTLTSLTGMISGDASTGAMLLRSYSANGTLGSPGEAIGLCAGAHRGRPAGGSLGPAARRGVGRVFPDASVARRGRIGMSLKRKIIVAVSCGVLAVAGVVIFGAPFFRDIPPDEELAAFFESHREGFASLKDMLSSEPGGIVGVTRGEVMLGDPWKRVTPEAAGMSQSRFETYQTLMKKNEVHQIWRHDGEIAIAAGFRGWGFASKGPRLAYVYRGSTPSSMVSALPARRGTDSETRTVCMALSAGWYVRLTW